MSTEYDYIVVGAGPAGCVVANRLSGSNHRVLLVEAGGPDTDEWVHVPAGFMQVITNPDLAWADRTAPGKFVDDRSITLLQGKLMGGSSAINGMLYVRGQRSDYDGWAAAGCPGWSWDDVLPHFVRHTSFDGGDPAVYGRTGELRLNRLAGVHRSAAAFLAAAQEAGIPFRADMNGGDQEGIGNVVATIDRGRRQSASVAFIDPIGDRPTLQVRTGTLGRRVIVERGRAVGVEIQTAEGTEVVTCSREVILSSGAITSPQILQHSGIGAGDHLRSLGVDVVADLPEVGKNLQDHLFGHLKFRLEDDGDSLNAELSDPERSRRHLDEWRTHGTGPLVTSSSQVLGFLRSEPNRSSPDVQLAMRPFSWSMGMRGIPEIDPFPGMMASAINSQPYSRGEVVITSPDPAERAQVNTDYLADDRDVDVIVHGMRRVRDVMAQSAISDRVVAEIDPGERVADTDALAEYLRASAATVYHPVGTCRMGSDPLAVVDPALRVRGVLGLRVIDNSVMPKITSGNTMAPAFLIGEKGADLILSSP